MTLSIGADEEQVIDLDFRDADAVINVNKEENAIQNHIKER